MWCRRWLLRRLAFGQFENLCSLRTCNVSGDGRQADTPDYQAQHELPQGAGPSTVGGPHSLLHGFSGHFQKCAVWVQSGIQLNLCADSRGSSAMVDVYHEEVIITPTTPDDWIVIANTNSPR